MPNLSLNLDGEGKVLAYCIDGEFDPDIQIEIDQETADRISRSTGYKLKDILNNLVKENK